MSLSTISNLKLRRLLVHIIAMVLIALTVYSSFWLDNIGDKLYWQQLGIAMAAILAFYVHTFALLPFYIIQKKRKRYIFFTIVGITVFCAAFSWLDSNYASSAILIYDKHMEPLYFFLTWKSWAGGLLRVLMFFIPFSSFSLLYYMLLLDTKKIKRIISLKFAELLINIMVVGSIFLLFFFAYPETQYLETWLIFFLMGIFFYGNIFFLTPILLREKKLRKIFSILAITTFALLSLIFLDYDIYSSDPFFNNIPFIIGSVSLILFIISFLYGSLRLKYQMIENHLNIQLGAKQSELSLLKSQVNPHFLFNTLNTLYGTALEEEAPKTGESISKLANLLRYMQDDMDKAFIPLEDEVAYIKDYIAIQELRYQISPQVEIILENLDGKIISPGILIPFVENAFKHGIDPSKPSQLFISVICDQTSIQFTCINSYDDDFKAYYKEQGFGLGIKNTKKRLELVYPKKYILVMTKENQTFTVKLMIKL